MAKKEYLLSLSSSPQGDQISLHADSEGLSVLINELESLRSALENNEAPHSHLMSKTWGLEHLTESMLQSEQKESYRQIHHIKLYAWSNKWVEKHEL